ncbi:6360_t:CDS:2 [Paraglomus occultum]|uniref:6360_t:CDS:1 n=1 Tax=Paraglomus occultum TaxID=144539 RepID=A0A9N9ALR2_9GLOM|nr:6360_t:CDS:2 [Paraglomus occultum]
MVVPAQVHSNISLDKFEVSLIAHVYDNRIEIRNLDGTDDLTLENYRWYEGCVVVRYEDHRISPTCTGRRTLLRPSSVSIWEDILRLNLEYGGTWTVEDAIRLESKLLLALYPNLDLDAMKPPLSTLDNSIKTPMINGIIGEPYRRIRMRRGAKRKLNSYEMEQEAAKQAEYENLMYTMDPRYGREFIPTFRQIKYFNTDPTDPYTIRKKRRLTEFIVEEGRSINKKKAETTTLVRWMRYERRVHDMTETTMMIHSLVNVLRDTSSKFEIHIYTVSQTDFPEDTNDYDEFCRKADQKEFREILDERRVSTRNKYDNENTCIAGLKLFMTLYALEGNELVADSQGRTDPDNGITVAIKSLVPSGLSYIQKPVVLPELANPVKLLEHHWVNQATLDQTVNEKKQENSQAALVYKYDEDGTTKEIDILSIQNVYSAANIAYQNYVKQNPGGRVGNQQTNGHIHQAPRGQTQRSIQRPTSIQLPPRQLPTLIQQPPNHHVPVQAPQNPVQAAQPQPANAAPRSPKGIRAQPQLINGGAVNVGRPQPSLIQRSQQPSGHVASNINIRQRPLQLPNGGIIQQPQVIQLPQASQIQVPPQSQNQQGPQHIQQPVQPLQQPSERLVLLGADKVQHLQQRSNPPQQPSAQPLSRSNSHTPVQSPADVPPIGTPVQQPQIIPTTPRRRSQSPQIGPPIAQTPPQNQLLNQIVTAQPQNVSIQTPMQPPQTPIQANRRPTQIPYNMLVVRRPGQRPPTAQIRPPIRQPVNLPGGHPNYADVHFRIPAGQQGKVPIQQLPNQPINQAAFANAQQIRIPQQTHNGGLPVSAQSPRQAPVVVPQQSRQTPQSHPQTPVISPASINTNGAAFISPTRQRPVQIPVPQTPQPMTSPATRIQVLPNATPQATNFQLAGNRPLVSNMRPHNIVLMRSAANGAQPATSLVLPWAQPGVFTQAQTGISQRQLLLRQQQQQRVGIFR